MVPRLHPPSNSFDERQFTTMNSCNGVETPVKKKHSSKKPEGSNNHILSKWGYSPDRKKTPEKRSMRVSPKRPQHPMYDSVLSANERDDGVVNPYQMLQIRVDATRSEIKQAYRRLALWHHPGRQSTMSEAEKARRERIFVVLAACCETLLERDSRTRLDTLLKRQPTKQNPSKSETIASVPSAQIATDANALPHWPGQKHSRRAAFRDSSSCPDMPVLYAADSDLSSQSGEGDAWLSWACGPETPKASSNRTISRQVRQSLTDCSSTEDADRIHYSEVETSRLFGGPLSMMYQARKFRSFTDPYIVFERYFGSAVFSSSSDTKKDLYCSTPTRISTALTSSKPSSSMMANSSRSSTWSGSVETLPDGSTIYTTERTLNGRKFIKQERISIDPVTGKKKSSITVTGEDQYDPHSEEQPSKNDLAASEDECMNYYWTCCNPSMMFSSLSEDCKFFARGRRKVNALPSNDTTNRMKCLVG